MNLKRLGAVVRQHRETAGLSQEKLADLSNLHKETIVRIERGTGKSGPHIAALCRIAEALGVSCSALLAEAELIG